MSQTAEPGAMRQSDVLATVLGQLSLAKSLNEVTALATVAVRALLQADGATFVLCEGDRCYYADEDAISPLWKGRRFPIRTCISGWCMLHEEPVVVPDVFLDPRIPGDRYRPTFVRSLAMAPLGASPALGALGAYWSDVREVSAEQVERLQEIADAAAAAMTRLEPQAGRGQAASEPPAAAAKETLRKAAPATARRPLAGYVARVRSRGLRPSSPEAYAFAVLCVTIATLAREIFRASGVQGLVVYSTYYPAAALALVVGGRRAGVLAAVLGGAAAYWFFMPPIYQLAAPTPSQALNLLLYGASSGLIILIIDWYQRAVQRLRHEDARHLLMAREQAHRVQNALSVVEAVVAQSLRQDPEQAHLINRRLRAALADVDMRPHAGVQPRSLRALLSEELQGFDLARFRLEGADDTPLAPELCSLVALAAHELSTNALKYGALSAADGCVTVDWRIEGGRATLSWREQGGPPVAAPTRRGYGAVLLRRLVETANGSLTLDYRPSGLAAELSLPLAPPPPG